MTEIAVPPKLAMSATNSCTPSSLGSQPSITSTVTVTPACHSSEESSTIRQLDTNGSNANVSSSFQPNSPPQRNPYVQQPNHLSDGYSTTCHQNVLTYSPKRTTSPVHQLYQHQQQQQQQHYHHHYSHYHSPHHNYHHHYHHHHYPYPNRQQTAVRQLQEFMLLQWQNFEYRHHQARSFGNASTEMKTKPYYSTPRYSQSKKDFQSTNVDTKNVANLSQGDRNSPINVSTKAPASSQMMSGSTTGDSWTTVLPFYRRKLVSSSGNLSPTQQQSLRHSGSVDTMTWQRGYSTFQRTNYTSHQQQHHHHHHNSNNNSNNNNNNNNNSSSSARLPPPDAGPRLTSPPRGHSVGSGSSSGGSTAGTGGGDGDGTVMVDVPQEPVSRASARKDRPVEVASRCPPAPQTILSRRPADHQRREENTPTALAQPGSLAVTDQHVPTSRREQASSGDGEQFRSTSPAAPSESTSSSSPPPPPPSVDSQRAADKYTAKPREGLAHPDSLSRIGATSPPEDPVHSKRQSDVPTGSSGEEGGTLRSEDEAGTVESPGAGVSRSNTGAADGYVTANDQTPPPASLPVAISVNTVSSSVSSGDGLAGGEHFWTPDPPASPANNVSTSNESGGQAFSLMQMRSSTIDCLNDVD